MRVGPVAGYREFFLVERHLLFAADPAGRLYSGRVHHAPYRVAPAVAAEISVAPARQAGFALAGDPVSVLAAETVDVPRSFACGRPVDDDLAGLRRTPEPGANRTLNRTSARPAGSFSRGA